jgi:short-subunit dehydrogenase
MRTALVSGASRGIGLAVARDLAAQGYGLTITARDAAALEKRATELTVAGAPEVVPCAADLADSAALPGVVARHEAAFGAMDALVLSGGVGSAGPLAVNLVSAVVLVQAALPLLRRAAAAPPGERTGARVILFSSITGVYAEPGLAVYGASKAGLVSLAETLNAEESGNGVLVTAIAPGYVDTAMSDWTKDTIPAESMIQVEDIVRIVRTLLELGRTASIPRIVVARSTAQGYGA